MTRFALLALLVGCVDSASVTCADGTTCPAGYQCDIDQHRCLLPDQLTACDGKVEGDDCNLDGAPGACRDGACETFFCGDGFVTTTEECDGTNLGLDDNGDAATCLTIGWYAPEGLRCTPACLWDRSATSGCGGGRCGDDDVNGPELCDGPTSKTCVAIGFDAGSVSCGADCGFQIRDCSRFGWNPESLSDVVALAVAGTGPDDQWAVGLGGRVMRYEGAFWNSVPTPVQNNLSAVWSIDPGNAYAVGLASANPARPSVLLHWDGVQWSVVEGLPAADLLDVWAADAANVFVATRADGVLRFDGSTWTSTGTFVGTPIELRGAGPTDLWLATVESPSTYHLYAGNGASWTEVTLPDTVVHFIDANAADDVWVAGHAADLGTGVIAHFDGSSWQRWATPATTYNGIAATAPNDAWVASATGIMYHYDGIAWSASTNIGASPSGLAALSGVISLGPTEVLGVSTLNLAYRYRGQTFGVYPALGSNPFDAPENQAMWGSSTNDQYVTNVRGEVWHYNGIRWTLAFQVPPNGTFPVAARAIWGDARTNVWVAADNGNVYHYDGATWTAEVAATTAIYKIWGSGGADVWAFTGAAAAHRNPDGTWSSMVLGGVGPRSVAGSGPEDIYTVDANGVLWHYDSSLVWTQVATNATFPLLAVTALSPTNVHVTAREGRMLKWDGAVWIERVVPALDELTFLAAAAPDDVIAASQRDLFHYNGTEWASIRPPIDFVPNTADYIPMIGVQVSPGRIDLLLQRYRIRTLLRTRPLACRAQESDDCFDGVDNDCDGALDSKDSECEQ